MFGNVPLGACLSYQLQDFGRPNTRFFKNCGVERNCDTENASPNNIQFPDIPITQNNMEIFNIAELNMLNQLGLSVFFARNVLIDIEEAHKLEKRTVLQGESEEWLKQRKYRLTASNFGKVYFRKQSPSESMLKSIFTPRDLSNVKSISHGKQKEKVARTIYAKKMQKDVPKFTIFDAGISVHPSFPYLGVTPDGKVLDPSSAQTFGLLEMKCPFSKRNETLEQAVADKDFYITKTADKFCLKETRAYYVQVQGQLAITGLTWCDFCVFLSESNEMCVHRINFDGNFWTDKLQPKLKQFYLNHGLKFITGQT